ncbi:esterase [Pyrenophora tritici-repentis]|nr:Alpha/beta-hydrolase [Pyrenophora tritici-repentis]KAI0584826.1 Alpha/beta-hydrolase [Pyrenophora tritici-repentis]KAI1528016.1 esterase [Pyrenophora tritici-repentis]KAI1534599.1 esterase [Pyrenophora tritici-repentis]KAI1548451.1 esterase [Pyrenophora tritici-repentis]
MYLAQPSSPNPPPPKLPKMTNVSTPHIIPPTISHKHTVIFLHGRGSDAETFASEVFESQDSSSRFFTDIFPSVKWIFPRAPFRFPQKDDNDDDMPVSTAEERIDEEEKETGETQWFDMATPQHPQQDPERQKPGLWQSVDLVLKILRHEIEIVGMQNVVLAGISQGCATGIFSLLASGMQVGGFVGLCGWLPLAEELNSVMHVPGRAQAVTKTPVLLQHCKDDQVVPVENGEDLRMRLEEMRIQVKFDCFDHGGHWLNEPEGMDGIVRFLQDVFKGT